jgi:hypothetical protein
VTDPRLDAVQRAVVALCYSPRMPEQRDNDSERLIQIEAVLEHLEQVKEDTLKMIASLQKQRADEKARLDKASNTR